VNVEPYDPLAAPTLACAVVTTFCVVLAWLLTLRQGGKPPRDEE
jgi:hypothetical protein